MRTHDVDLCQVNARRNNSDDKGRNMAVVWGRKATGKDGPMTETEVVDALYTNSGWRRSRRNH